MRGLVFLWITSLFLGATFPAEAEVPAPRFRPAVLGSGPDSLVNQIDTQDLLKKGQKDGAIMFCCRVATTGDVGWYRTYLPVPGSDLLEAEVRKRLDKARLAPAIYEHKPVEVLFQSENFPAVHANAFKDPIAIEQPVVVDADFGVLFVVELAGDVDLQGHGRKNPNDEIRMANLGTAEIRRIACRVAGHSPS